MYQHILIPLENSAADETILAHIKPLARLTNARIQLVHVADGWVARNFDQLKLAESEEMKQDRAYLEERQRELINDGFSCDALLALGEPSDEIIKLAREKDHTRPSLHQRHPLRRYGGQSAARRGCAGVAFEGKKLGDLSQHRARDLPCFAPTSTTDARESASPNQRISALHLRRGRSACGISVARTGQVDAGRSPLLRRSKGQVR